MVSSASKLEPSPGSFGCRWEKNAAMVFKAGWVGEWVFEGEIGDRGSFCVEEPHGIWGGRKNGEVERNQAPPPTRVDPGWGGPFFPLCLRVCTYSLFLVIHILLRAT